MHKESTTQFNNTLEPKGLSLNNIHHFLLMLTPNIFSPKLIDNLRHPIGEWIHTSHKQFPIDNEGSYVVEHYLGERLVTVDLVKQDEWKTGMGCIAQLFAKDFYYGHDKFFPYVFKLQGRYYFPENNRTETLGSQ